MTIKTILLGCLKLTYQNESVLKIVSSKKELTSNKSALKGYSAYLYGFQSQERDDEIKGAGNSYNYKYRMHDPRLGRFFAVDPLTKAYPYYSPYQFSGNSVINSIELEGLEPFNVIELSNHLIDKAKTGKVTYWDIAVGIYKGEAWKIHTGLDVLGMVPLVGEIADGAKLFDIMDTYIRDAKARQAYS